MVGIKQVKKWQGTFREEGTALAKKEWRENYLPVFTSLSLIHTHRCISGVCLTCQKYT